MQIVLVPAVQLLLTECILLLLQSGLAHSGRTCIGGSTHSRIYFVHSRLVHHPLFICNFATSHCGCSNSISFDSPLQLRCLHVMRFHWRHPRVFSLCCTCRCNCTILLLLGGGRGRFSRVGAISTYCGFSLESLWWLSVHHLS